MDLISKEANKAINYFFNINPVFFTSEIDEEFYHALTSTYRPSILPEQIVLEITEESFSNEAGIIVQRLRKYRELGCKIAIDDFGKGFSNLERVAAIQPNILKVDLYLVQKSTYSLPYKNILHTLSILSEKIGASLLYEGIETVENLKNAWRNGAQFYQGYLFSKPQPTFSNYLDCESIINEQVESMIQEAVERVSRKFSVEEYYNKLLKESVETSSFQGDYNQYVASFTEILPGNCFRLYLCDPFGYQKSANHYRKCDTTWLLQEEFYNRNWSWRPYFIENIIYMKLNNKGILSEAYADIETNEQIRTFSYPLEENLYLFIDLRLH